MVAMEPEGILTSNKGKTKTKKLLMRWIHINNILKNLGNPGEDRMNVTAKPLHYNIMGTLEVCKDWNLAKKKHKLLQKVAEER